MITIQSQDRRLKVYPEGKRFPYYYEAVYPASDEYLFSHPVARDLIRIGQAIFTADRAVRRKMAVGSQTRDIHVQVLLEKPDILINARNALIDFAEFCTRDNWHFEFASLIFKKPVQQRQPPEVDCVALLSDGLDSLCGAARLIGSGAHPVFVSHYQPRWGYSTAVRRIKDIAASLGRQEEVFPAVSIRYNLSDKGKDGRYNYFPETTRRSRPCLYLCYAAAVAVEYGIGKIFLHENGILALNLPFSRSNIGAQISRHAHPLTLFKLQNFLSVIWPHQSDSPKVENPFFYLTKEDQVAQFCKQLPRELVESTVSCENASRALLSYKGKLEDKDTHFTQCGMCTPCLIRRQAMLANDFKEKHVYPFPPKGPAKDAKDLPAIFNRENAQVLKQYCKEIAALSETDFMLRYFTELSLLSACTSDLQQEIRNIYALQKRFADQYLKMIK